MALRADELIGSQDIVIKSLSENFVHIRGLSGASILGDGRVSLILDIAALSVLVSEAGGLFTDLNGEPPGLETRSVLAATPALHAIYLELLRGFVT